MNQTLKKLPLTAKAFSLIEVLVVVVLIGILTAIAAPDYFLFRQKVDLQESTQLIENSLKQAYSLSRSRSKHYIIRNQFSYDPSTQTGNTRFLIRECEQIVCSAGPINTIETIDLAGETIFTNTPFRAKFLAPHGDMVLLTPNGIHTPLASTDSFVLSLDNNGLTKDVNILERSGLVTTDTP